MKVAAFLFGPMILVAWLGKYRVIPADHLGLLLVLSLLLPFVAMMLIANRRDAREAAQAARKDRP